MPEYLKIDTSFSTRMRTGRTVIASQADFKEPQAVPAIPMPGRRLLRIFNYGLLGDPSINVFAVVGDRSIRWVTTSDDIWGYGLSIYEFVDLAVDADVQVYAIADIDLPTRASIDLRTMEFA